MTRYYILLQIFSLVLYVDYNGLIMPFKEPRFKILVKSNISIFLFDCTSDVIYIFKKLFLIQDPNSCIFFYVIYDFRV